MEVVGKSLKNNHALSEHKTRREPGSEGPQIVGLYIQLVEGVGQIAVCSFGNKRERTFAKLAEKRFCIFADSENPYIFRRGMLCQQGAVHAKHNLCKDTADACIGIPSGFDLLNDVFTAEIVPGRFHNSVFKPFGTAGIKADLFGRKASEPVNKRHIQGIRPAQGQLLRQRITTGCFCFVFSSFADGFADGARRGIAVVGELRCVIITITHNRKRLDGRTNIHQCPQVLNTKNVVWL